MHRPCRPVKSGVAVWRGLQGHPDSAPHATPRVLSAPPSPPPPRLSPAGPEGYGLLVLSCARVETGVTQLLALQASGG